MSQNDFIIDNQSFPATRADLTNAFQALASLNSGSSQPSTTYANMLWYDTGANILKMRSEADDAWINVAYVDQSTNAWRVLDDTQVVNTSGTQTGLIGDQATATWETGTGTTESLVSPAKVKAAVEALGYTDAQARAAQAGHAVGSVGSYAFLRADNTATATAAGTTVAGSTMRYGDIDFNKSGTPAGTWRCMGYAQSRNYATLYLRIS